MSPEISSAIDSIEVSLSVGGMNVINTVLSFVMFGIALDIHPSVFIDVLKKPKGVLIGALCQFLLLPSLTFLLAIALGDLISPMIALGMILVASCPGGNISNFISSISKANIELSVSLTAINTLLAIVMTPLNFWVWSSLYLKISSITAEIPYLSIPVWEVFKTIVILLGIPLVLGVLCTRFLPKLANALKKPMQYLSIIFFIVMVVLSFYSNIDAFLKCIKYIFLVVFIHNLLALGIGYGTALSFKLPERDRRTLSIETGIQNSGLGLVLLFNPLIFGHFPPHGGMLVITAWWAVWHIVSGLTIALIFNLKDARKKKNNQKED